MRNRVVAEGVTVHTLKSIKSIKIYTKHLLLHNQESLITFCQPHSLAKDVRYHYMFTRMAKI